MFFEWTIHLGFKLVKTAHAQKKKGTKAVTGAVPFQEVHFCNLSNPKGAY